MSIGKLHVKDYCGGIAHVFEIFMHGNVLAVFVDDRFLCYAKDKVCSARAINRVMVNNGWAIA